jgi:hypothetical protein
MPRVQYSDVVINESGRPVVGVIVSIAPVAGSTGTGKLWENETGEAELTSVVTNAKGVFSVWLDEGRYDVTPTGATKRRVEMISDQTVEIAELPVTQPEITESGKGNGEKEPSASRSTLVYLTFIAKEAKKATFTVEVGGVVVYEFEQTAVTSLKQKDGVTFLVPKAVKLKVTYTECEKVIPIYHLM